MEPINYTCFHIIAALSAVGLPLVSFFWSALAGKRHKSAGPGITTIALSLACSIYLFTEVWNTGIIRAQVTWFKIGDHVFTAGILVNNMSVLMLVLVSFIALLVHIYSVTYMKGDPGIHRYWMYLSLFCCAMLGLVIADNLLLMYVCWELVGFASYLLIGFWFTKEAAVQANKKAFIINRIGDIGFLIGIALLYTQFGTMDLHKLFSEEGLVDTARISHGLWIAGDHQLPAYWLTVAGLAFFLGAMAKSSQFPLHAWLPDAMEGPTSVSSLIHAATMVAAGVFLLARIFPLFNDTVLLVMTILGSLTALMAASIALTQHDLKKILAFSTISQLGFMVTAVGIGMYGVALFHLVTHAFFKCLLFLSAGSIIHEMQHVKEQHQLDFDAQDIRNMGGLRRQMPVTFGVTLVAALALSGLPLTAGYLSKDALLIHSFEWAAWRGGFTMIIPLSLLATSVCTTFYIARLVFKVFYGKLHLHPAAGKKNQLHDAGLAMRIPMLVLAACSLFPLFSVNPLVFEDSWLLRGFSVAESMQRVNFYHTIIPASVNMLGVVAIFIAWRWYAIRRYPLKTTGWLYRFSAAQWHVNAVYSYVFVKPVLWLAAACFSFDKKIVDGLVHTVGHAGRALSSCAAWVDRYLVDGLVNGVAGLASGLGNVLRRSQTGRLQYYMLSMFVVVLIIWLFNFFQ